MANKLYHVAFSHYEIDIEEDPKVAIRVSQECMHGSVFAGAGNQKESELVLQGYDLTTPAVLAISRARHRGGIPLHGADRRRLDPVATNFVSLGVENTVELA